MRTVSGLQAQIDRFVSFYNLERPHKARDRMTPLEAFRIRDRAEPGTPLSTTHYRVRTDRIDDSGSLAPLHSKMFHIGIGRRFKRMPVRLYIADLDVRVVTIDGELLRHPRSTRASATRASAGRSTSLRAGSRVRGVALDHIGGGRDSNPQPSPWKKSPTP